MKICKSIAEYFAEVHLPPSKYPHIFVGRHEDYMDTLKIVQSPVKHELYSISIVTSDWNMKINQAVSKKVFILSPFKTVEWDWSNINIKERRGIVVIFSNDFIESNVLWKNFLLDFPFFRHSAFFNEDLSPALIEELYSYGNKIHEYYYGNNSEKFELIKSYMQIMLLLLRQEYNRRINTNTTFINNTNNKLLADFEVMLINALEHSDDDTDFRQPSFYAAQLYVHINHLNAVVKQLTGKTTSEIIHEHIIRKASAELRQADVPVKEIASRLHFSATTHFIAFFKKHAGLTPKQYRESFSGVL